LLTSRTPLVSVIVDTYYRPEMLKHAIRCLREQTYRNLEIVIVNNGATAETISYLAEIEKIESRVKLVHFETNQFSWDDPCLMVRVCYNAGLNASTGELVFYQSDDDWVAADFIERMVALFLGNPDCTTAKGRSVNVLPDGGQVPVPPAIRERYIPGLELAVDYMNGSKKIQQRDAGFSFVMLRDELLKLGGFHADLENQQYFAMVPFGVTGYDPDAHMYWRRHELQLNKIGNARGVFWGMYGEQFLADRKISVVSRWRSRFGDEKASALENFILDIVSRDYCKVIAHRIFGFQPVEAVRFIRRFFNSPARRRMTWANFLRGSHFGMLMTPLGRTCWRCYSLAREMLLNPVATTGKVLRRIRAPKD
jgi:glycosyltransferase involved in cell wall biosynthesis